MICFTFSKKGRAVGKNFKKNVNILIKIIYLFHNVQFIWILTHTEKNKGKAKELINIYISDEQFFV